MISLDPEFVGGLAPTSKLTTVAAMTGAPEVPFARLPRIERLRVSGKADETEVNDEEDGEEAGEGAPGEKANTSRMEKEKKKMRGRNKTLKRYAPGVWLVSAKVNSPLAGICASNARMLLTLARYVFSIEPCEAGLLTPYVPTGRSTRENGERERSSTKSKSHCSWNRGSSEAFRVGSVPEVIARPQVLVVVPDALLLYPCSSLQDTPRMM